MIFKTLALRMVTTVLFFGSMTLFAGGARHILVEGLRLIDRLRKVLRFSGYKTCLPMISVAFMWGKLNVVKVKADVLSGTLISDQATVIPRALQAAL